MFCKNIKIIKEKQTLTLGMVIAKGCFLIKKGITIYLSGDLGAGKTTFARGFLSNFGIKKVKSPTYTIVESYEINKRFVHHFDCYRLMDSSELEFIGIREYQDSNNICLFEWAENATGYISSPDLTIKIKHTDDIRDVTLQPHNEIGNAIISNIK